jgi:hypothetical protein
MGSSSRVELTGEQEISGAGMGGRFARRPFFPLRHEEGRGGAGQSKEQDNQETDATSSVMWAWTVRLSSLIRSLSLRVTHVA